MNVPKKRIYSAYSHRDVIGLRPLHDLEYKEIEAHMKHNRVLQYNFATRDGNQLLKDGIESGESWITDFVCPSCEAALIMHLSKEMVVRYKVPEDKIGEFAQKAYNILCSKEKELFSKLKHTVEERFLGLKQDPEFEDRISNLAKERLERNKRYLESKGKSLDTQDPAKIEAAKRIVLDMEKKRITNQAIAQYIGSHRDALEDEVGIERKDLLFKGKNIDYVFQGAAGSGKSTISRQFLDDETKKNYITLATDNYRGVEVPGTHRHEEGNETKNIFIRTQDMAYLVKELVHEELQSIIDRGSRPNIIIDCVNMDEFMHSLLEGSKEVNSFVAAYTGDSGIGIAERAEKRALTSEAPADKGRFMNTDSLFYSHASVSQNLLSAVPQTVITKIHSTDVDYGDEAPRIAEIDPIESNLRIYDLRLSSSFFNKKDIYTKAQSPIELAQGKYGDSLSVPKKAEIMLDIIKNKHGGKSYSLDLFENTESSKKYASITSGKRGNLELKIHDKELFEKLAYDPASIQGGILRSISRQIAYGSRKNEMSQIAERKEERLEADILSFEEAYNHIKETKRSQIIEESNGIDGELIKKAISVVSKSLKPQRKRAGLREGNTTYQARGRSLRGIKSDRIL